MKKRIAMALVVCMSVSMLAGCGTKKKSAAPATNDANTTIVSGENEGQEATSTGASFTCAYATMDTDYNLADEDTLKYVTSLCDYMGIPIDAVKEEITEETLNDFIELNVLPSAATDEDLAEGTVVEEGDYVYFTCVGTMDGEVFDGGSTQEGELWDTELGSNGFIPDLEAGMVGMKVGETKAIDCVFPQNYYEELAGKTATFTVMIDSATRSHVPTELNEDVAKELGYDNVDALIDEVRTYLEEDAQTDYDMAVEDAIVAYLLENSECQTPPEKLIASFFQSQANYYEYYATYYYQVDLETFVYYMFGMDIPAFEQQIIEVATNFAKQYLILETIADKEGIDLSDEALDAEAQITMESYGYTDKNEFLTDFGDTDFRDYVMVSKVLRLIRENAVFGAADSDAEVEAGAEETQAE